jgi:hypothetical protein
MADIIVADTGNPTTNGTNLATANSGAVSGDVIKPAAGTFDLGTARLVLAAGVNLVGAGKLLTIIKGSTVLTGSASAGCMVVPGSGSVVSDLTIWASIDNSVTFTYQAPFGVQNKAPMSQPIFSSAELRRVKLIGGSDGVFLSANNGSAACVLRVYDCEIVTTWDAHNQINSIPTGTWNVFTEYFRTKFTVTGPNTDTTHTYRGISTFSGTVRLHNCQVVVNSNDPDPTTATIGLSISSANAGAQAQIVAINTSVSTSLHPDAAAAEAQAYDAAVNGRPVTLANCMTDGKYNGTPTVVSGGTLVKSVVDGSRTLASLLF